jgi:hypothetical protein
MTKKKKQVFPQNCKGKFILLAAARSGKTAKYLRALELIKFH